MIRLRILAILLLILPAYGHADGARALLQSCKDMVVAAILGVNPVPELLRPAFQAPDQARIERMQIVDGRLLFARQSFTMRTYVSVQRSFHRGDLIVAHANGQASFFVVNQASVAILDGRSGLKGVDLELSPIDGTLYDLQQQPGAVGYAATRIVMRLHSALEALPLRPQLTSGPH